MPVVSAGQSQEGKRSWLGPLLCWVYGFGRPRLIMRPFSRWLIEKIEGGQLYSLTLREIMNKYHGVEIGLYSYGGAFIPGHFGPGTKIGRFCSVYWTARSFNAKRLMNLKSTSPLFTTRTMGFGSEDLVIRHPRVIGNDVFIGHNAVINPSVKTIGDGAFIGAGAVVYEDVPPYAIVIGHPARVVSYRFKREIIEKLLAERWWDKPLSELVQDLGSFRRTLDGGPLR
ncbi:MAG: hypothetical protein A3G20_06495 [Acidobacteria bacterium RIFCSPLOWO2_12_FULL_59_11]|nr:MAG: hypothetical protein A3G20_06495 [Acidobacteria bacterium RIFCSPLOWO2_12_FULL_59_11]